MGGGEGGDERKMLEFPWQKGDFTIARFAVSRRSSSFRGSSRANDVRHLIVRRKRPRIAKIKVPLHRRYAICAEKAIAGYASSFGLNAFVNIVGKKVAKKALRYTSLVVF